MAGRFEFPGMRCVQQMDTATHEIEVHHLEADGSIFVLEMIRSVKASRHGTFLVAKVLDVKGNALWSFKEEGFSGVFGKLALYEGEHLIYLEDCDRKIHRVIPVRDLPKCTKVQMGDRVVRLGGRSGLELLQFKMRLAKHRHVDYVVLLEEEKLREKLQDFEAALKKEQAEANAVAAAERKERQAALLARPDIKAYNQSGAPVYGTPVVEDEWKSLPDGKRTIEVASYDPVTGETGAPIAAFFVKKSRGGQCSQERRQENLLDKPPAKPARTEAGAPIAKSLGVLFLEIECSPVEVFHFDKENFRLLREQRVNSGAVVAVGEPTADGKYTIIRLDGDKYLTVGQGKPFST